jgi:hypothetical protein
MGFVLNSGISADLASKLAARKAVESGIVYRASGLGTAEIS